MQKNVRENDVNGSISEMLPEASGIQQERFPWKQAEMLKQNWIFEWAIEKMIIDEPKKIPLRTWNSAQNKPHSRNLYSIPPTIDGNRLFASGRLKFQHLQKELDAEAARAANRAQTTRSLIVPSWGFHSNWTLFPRQELLGKGREKTRPNRFRGQRMFRRLLWVARLIGAIHSGHYTMNFSLIRPRNSPRSYLWWAS